MGIRPERHSTEGYQTVIKRCVLHLSGMDCREMDFYEDYQSPFDFDTGVNKNYLYLSPSGNSSPSGSPTLQKCGLLRTDPVPEEGEDVAATISATETLSEEEQEELRRELAKVEEEIQTLSQVLAAKEKHLAEIKRKLGINSLQELKQNIAKGWQDVTATSAYKKTSETLSQAGQKASAAFSSVGSVITKKLEDVKNSPTFKSFEEKVENLKSKVGGTKPAGGDFGEVLNSAANASAPEPLPEQTQGSP
ncbi:tumor protein D52 isoform X3 [Zalophus californianus]|uniref:Tumor protein D52 isoform X3 n=1 Tax=Zalophus californianus TaxID=9704 RepID=A0A6J2F2F3_ZALCA|nr:tumor protein D52 isoform X3 [Zalophus californianus]